MRLYYFIAGLISFWTGTTLDYRSSLGLFELNRMFRGKDGFISLPKFAAYVVAVSLLAVWLYLNDYEHIHTVSLIGGGLFHAWASRRNRRLRKGRQ